jgi:hypothetical protein
MEQLLSRPKPPTQGFKSIAPRNGPIHIQQWLLKKVLIAMPFPVSRQKFVIQF